MSIEIKVPPLPESVTDATLVAWHKKAGDSVARDENLVDLETDKVVLEVPAPADGVIQELKTEEGATVTAGDVLAILEEGEVTAAAPEGASPEKEAAPAPNAAAAPAKRSPGSNHSEAGSSPTRCAAAPQRRRRVRRSGAISPPQRRQQPSLRSVRRYG